MKKTLLILVSAVLVFGVVACSGGDDAAAPEPTGVKATDNPSIGTPVSAGGGEATAPPAGNVPPAGGEVSAGKGAKPAGRGSK